jgi:hypothetical protein
MAALFHSATQEAIMVRKTKETAPKTVKEDAKSDDKAKDTAKSADKGQNYDEYWSQR